jgi:arylsulfatase A-like enzyme
MRFQQALTPDKPFFIYFAPGAVHAPHHVPQSYIDKQKGNFDEGWDVIRERFFEQQKKLGVLLALTFAISFFRLGAFFTGKLGLADERI